MLRSLFVDPLRLLTRWAWKRWGCRLQVFMALPTRREMRVMVARGFYEITVDLDSLRGELTAPRDHQTLH